MRWENTVLKWVVGLCAAIYVTLLVLGEPTEGDEALAVVEEVEPLPIAEAIAPDPVKEVEAETLGEPVSTAALETAFEEITVEAIEPTEKPITAEAPLIDVAAAPTSQVAPPPQAEPEQSVAETALEEEIAALKDRGIGEIWRVTGSSVNLRAEATTQSDILGRTQRGDSAEVIELLENGWARVYVLETGQEAFMSAKFLTRDAQ